MNLNDKCNNIVTLTYYSDVILFSLMNMKPVLLTPGVIAWRLP